MSKRQFYFTQIFFLAAIFIFFTSGAQGGFLYVLNQQNGANQIYGYVVNESTGVLTPLFGFPVATGGNGNTGTASEQLVIDRVNKRLYVVNRASNNIGAYSINTAIGALTPLPFSPITGIANEISIAVHPSGSPLIVAGGTIATSAVASYNVTATTATGAAGNNFSTGGARPFSSVFSRDGNFYYVGGGLSNSFAGFGVNPANGVLSTLAGSPYGTGATNPLAMATDTQGRLFITTGISGGTVLRAYTTASGVPTQVFSSSGTGLTNAADGVLSPNEQFYLVADNTAGTVGSFQINGAGAGTTLTAAGSPVPTNGSTTNALAFNEAGTFVFAANSSSRSITTFAFDQSTGALTNINVQPNDSLGTTGFLAGMDYLPAVAPTAAAVSVSGRVVTAGGTLVSRVIVTLTDMNGKTRSASTNSFGYFRFDNVEAGQTYVLTAINKKYQFTPPTQVISLQDNLADVDFIAF